MVRDHIGFYTRGYELTLVLAVGITVPIFVFNEHDLLVLFKCGKLIGAVCHISVKRCAVVGDGKISFGCLAAFIKLFIDKPCGCHRGYKLEPRLYLSGDINKLIIVCLIQTDILKGGFDDFALDKI